MRKSNKIERVQQSSTKSPPRLRDLLDPVEIAEQKAYQRQMLRDALGDMAEIGAQRADHRRVINEALGRPPLSRLDLLDILKWVSQQQGWIDDALARLDELAPAAPNAPSRRWRKP